MSSLWTPSGEPPPGDEPPGAPDGGPTAISEEELAVELARARAELAATPVTDIVANHAVGLWQLAVLHLSPDPGPDGRTPPPRLDEAMLAIDAFGALVEGLGTRLAPHDEALRDALSQLRLAFVAIAERGREPAGTDDEGDDDEPEADDPASGGTAMPDGPDRPA